MTIEIMAVVFMTVASLSLVVQTTSLYRLRAQRALLTEARRLASKGLHRTSISRVVAAVMYVGLAAVGLASPSQTGFLSTVVFTVVQFIWWTNALLDVRLRQSLAEPSPTRDPRGRHRK